MKLTIEFELGPAQLSLLVLKLNGITFELNGITNSATAEISHRPHEVHLV